MNASRPIATLKNSSLTLSLAKRLKKITVRFFCSAVLGRMIWNSLKSKWKAVPRRPLPPKSYRMLTITLRCFLLLTRSTNNKSPQSPPEYQTLVPSPNTTSLSRNLLATLCPLTGHPTVQLKKPRHQSGNKINSQFPTVNRKCTFTKWKSWNLLLTSWGDKIKNCKKSANSSKTDASNLRIRCFKSQVPTVITWWQMKFCCKRWKASHFGSFTSKHRKWLRLQWHKTTSSHSQVR